MEELGFSKFRTRMLTSNKVKVGRLTVTNKDEPLQQHCYHTLIFNLKPGSRTGLEFNKKITVVPNQGQSLPNRA